MIVDNVSITKLIVNYIPVTFTTNDLYDLFSPIGKLKCFNLVTFYKKNLGYGFVEYVDPKDANLAIRKINGLRIQDKTLKVIITVRFLKC